MIRRDGGIKVWGLNFYTGICREKKLKIIFWKTIQPENLKPMWKHRLCKLNFVYIIPWRRNGATKGVRDFYIGIEKEREKQKKSGLIFNIKLDFLKKLFTFWARSTVLPYITIKHQDICYCNADLISYSYCCREDKASPYCKHMNVFLKKAVWSVFVINYMFAIKHWICVAYIL